MPRPLVPLAVAYAGGIAAERVAGVAQLPWLLAAAGALLAGAAAWRARLPALLRAAAALLFLCLGGQGMAVALHGHADRHASRLPEEWLADPVGLEAWVVQPPDPRPSETRDGEEPGRIRLVVELLRVRLGERWVEASGRARITLYQQDVRVEYGDEIRGTFRLRHPRRFGNPGSFDYPEYLATQGIFLEGWTRDPVVSLPAGRGSRIRAATFSLRSLLLQRLDAALPGERGGLLKATVLGDRSGLTPEMTQAFLDSGTYHILAISGLNVSLLAGALFGLFRLLRVSGRLAAAAAALLVTSYAALAGAGPSVVRAAVMADVYLLAVVLDRRGDLLNTLALAVLGLLWWNPRYLADVGFQLTVLATLGIVSLVPWCEARLRGWPRAGRWLAESAGITLAATLMTLPILAGAFQRLSPVGVVANLPIVPLSGALTALGTATCALLLAVPAGLPWLMEANGRLVELLVALAAWFAAWPGSTVSVYPPTPAMQGLYYLGLAGAVLAAAARPRGWRRAGAALAGACLVMLLLLVGVRLRGGDDAGRVRLTMLDVGQGEAILVELPGRRRMLVDAGSLSGEGFDIGAQVVAPYLRHAWVGRLDVLVLTHAQADHMSGAPAILRAFPVGEVWSPAPLGPSATGLWIEEYLRHRRVPHRIVSAAAPPVAWGDARVEVLYPPATFEPSPGAREPASLVLAVGIAGRAALLTGDITVREGEGELAERRVRAAVLKVPHHGSRTSSSAAFLDAVRPEVALISAGYRNRFRHPHPEVLERYAARGI
ncbi:MAG: DNA internalization-related competence protein ComEC/Rec2, partial [Candidatus Methylomirabilales bacterium]